MTVERDRVESLSVEKNKVVSIEYAVYDDATKELVDQNSSDNPLEFLVGGKNIIPGLEKSLMGLSENETKSVVVSPEDAYGAYDDSALEEVAIAQFEGIDLKEGMTLYAKDEQGNSIPAIVKTIGESNVIVDYNHPLAGKTLSFKVEVLNIREATQSEQEMGQPAPKGGGGCCGGGCGTSSASDAKEEAVGCCNS